MPNKTTIPTLTKAEEAIMKAVWAKENVYVKEIVTALSNPQPHYNTVNTLLKILEEKGFVTSEKLGGSRAFKAIISKDAYAARSMKKVMNGYFDNSVAKLLSFFVEDNQIDLEELDEILNNLKKQSK